MKLFFFLSIVYFTWCDAFLPTNFGAKETDFSHKSITENAVNKASALYIAKFLKPGVYNDTDLNEMKVIHEFFGHDTASLKDYLNVVGYLVYGNNNAQRQYGANAMYTMNAEQIENGNLLLQNKRDTIIRLAKSPNPDWNFIRLTIGEFLMTLQMFYSNTNWIELKGLKVNTALGIRGKTMLPVAPSSMATCDDCNYTIHAILDGSCENNLRHNGDYLTSGYKSGQHTTKPIGLWVGRSGKCSHGGSWDDTRSIYAGGGINKETSDPNLSPHFRLHEQAGKAAIEATVYFLVGDGVGLLHAIGSALFGDLLNLHATCYNCLDPKLSLTFVIDNTGSMGDDIAAVRKTSIDIVNQASLTGGVANYVLATFNDPVTKNTIRKTQDGNIFINWLQNLRATGGGDCPEFAMRGLLDGIQNSLPGSCVFFFTDADPKDPELESQVVQTARNKDIHLMLFLRGQCDGGLQEDNSSQPSCVRRNDRENVGSRRKREIGGMFSSLASSTSSSTVKVPNSAISKTIGDIIDNSVGINHIYIANLTMNSGSLKFPIDVYIKLFTIEAKGASQNNIKLLRPDGTLETFSSNSTTIDNIGVAIVISVKIPVVGIYELQNTGSPFDLIVKGKGSIDFTIDLMEKVNGISYPISGSSPITGSNMTIGLTVKDLNENDTIDKIILRSKTDDILKEKNVRRNSKSSSREMSADFEVPSKPFRITIQGTDTDRNKFRRTSKEVITPVTGNIDILPLSDDLIKGIPTDIYVNVTNAGSSQQTFTVISSDTENYLQLPKQKTITIPPQGSSTVTFKLIGTTKLAVTTISLLLRMGSQILQRKTKSVMVKNSVPPIFTIIRRSKNCSQTYMNNINCSLGEWSMEVKVICSQPCVKLNVQPSSACLKHDELNKSGDVTANISGSCCLADSKLVAVDSLSNLVELPIDFTDGQPFETIKSSNQDSNKEVDPPGIVIVDQSKNCTPDYMNSNTCTHGTWWASLNIIFQVAGSKIYVTPEKSEVGDGSSAQIAHDDLKSMKKIIQANISGTCCLYVVSLFAKDSGGQLSRRKLDFSGGIQFQKVIADKEFRKNYDNASAGGPDILVGIIVLSAFVVTIVL